MFELSWKAHLLEKITLDLVSAIEIFIFNHLPDETSLYFRLSKTITKNISEAHLPS